MADVAKLAGDMKKAKIDTSKITVADDDDVLPCAAHSPEEAEAIRASAQEVALDRRPRFAQLARGWAAPTDRRVRRDPRARAQQRHQHAQRGAVCATHGHGSRSHDGRPLRDLCRCYTDAVQGARRGVLTYYATPCMLPASKTVYAELLSRESSSTGAASRRLACASRSALTAAKRFADCMRGASADGATNSRRIAHFCEAARESEAVRAAPHASHTCWRDGALRAKVRGPWPLGLCLSHTRSPDLGMS